MKTKNAKHFLVSAGLSLVLSVGFCLSLKWFLEVLLVSDANKVAICCGSTALFFAISLLCIYLQQKRWYYSKKREMILYAVASGLAPLIQLFLYVSKNSENFKFSDCLWLGLLLATVGVLFYLVLSLFCDPGSALIVTVLWWVLFWFSPTLIHFYPTYVFVFLILCALSLAIVCARRFQLDRMTGIILACVICVLFSYNFGNSVVQYAKRAAAKLPFDARDDFTVDPNLDHPDIYWLHMDGMMGFEIVESILGDNQDEFKKKLLELGFDINEKARLNVGWTSYAIPALTSPSLYDAYFQPLFSTMDGLTHIERLSRLDPDFDIYKTYSNLELFEAFKKGQYKTYCVLFDIVRGIENIHKDYSYDLINEQSQVSNIISFLSNYSIFAMFQDYMLQALNQHTFSGATFKLDKRIPYTNPNINFEVEGIAHYDMVLASILEDIASREGPKIVYLQDLMPHFPYQYDESGIRKEVDSDHIISMYLPQQKYSVKVLLGMVNYILEIDPDAIIVIQGDHGAHAFNRIELEKQGYTDDQMLEMNFSTISAVRIPEKYGTLTEPLDPLDISRYLVNHFVGEGNYNYLHYHEEE